MYNDTCNDLVNTIFPLATEIVGNGIDQNCNGTEICHGELTSPFDLPEVECLWGSEEDYETRYENGWTYSDGPWGPSECPDYWDDRWLDLWIDEEIDFEFF